MTPLTTPKILLMYKSSLRKFFDRNRHVGMTYKDFWDEYLPWIKTQKIYKYRNIPQFIEENELASLYMLTQMFKKALHLRDDSLSGGKATRQYQTDRPKQ